MTAENLGIPGYRDLHRIGQGGFSVVYRAMQDRLDRLVAVKVLASEVPDERARRRFEHECQLVNRLAGHPNVVTVLDTGTTGSGRPYIAMDYFSGGSLRDHLAKAGPLPVAEVLRIGVKIAGALAAAHQAGILHRDIKPENILVSRYGEPALADFGVAWLIDGLDPATRTQAFTAQHAAPEVLDGGAASPASDIYALGSTLYQLLAGHPPYERRTGEGIAQLVLRILREDPPELDRADVPPSVRAALRQALARDPQARFADAATVAATLQRLQAVLGLAVTDRPADVPTEFPPPDGARAGADTAEVLPTGVTGRAPVAGAEATMLRTDRQRTAAPHRPRPSRWHRLRWPLLIGATALLLAGGTGAAYVSTNTIRQVAAVASSSTVPVTRSASPTASASPTTPAPPVSPTAAASAAATTPRSAAATPAPPPADRLTPALLGPPDFAGYCAATGQGTAHLVLDNAYGWHCSADNGTGDDAQAVCEWTYHSAKVANRVANFNDPNSWQCWRANGKLGGLDFDAYCRDLGYPGATSTGTDAYSWFCNGTSAGIDAQAACARLYRSEPPISRFQNFYDKNSWQCWG